MTIAAILHSDEAPSGENLEYEKVFTDLLLAAQPEEERQAGNEIIERAEPDPKQIRERSVAVLADSNDIRAAILWGYAGLRIDGLSALATTTAYLRTCLLDFWDTCHPQLDAEDDDDPTMRVNAVLALVDSTMFLRAVRLAPLTASPAFGKMSLRDIAIAEGELSTPADMASPPTPQTVSAAFQDTPPEILTDFMAAARSAQEDIIAINAVFDERIPTQGPSLEPLSTMIKRIVAAIAPMVGVPEDEADAEDGAPQGAAGTSAAAAIPGAVNTRADVDKALSRIIDYYAKSEPSSPVPILLRRAQRLIGADFMTVMTELAPLGLDNVRLIGGMENPE